MSKSHRLAKASRSAEDHRLTPARLPAACKQLADVMARAVADDARSGVAVPGSAQAAHMASALRDAELYWVTADMTQVAVAAAAGIPPWTATAVVPAPSGLLAWAEPPLEITTESLPERLCPINAFGVPTAPVVPVRAVQWYHRDAKLRLTALTATTSLLSIDPRIKLPDVPLWMAAGTIVMPADWLITFADRPPPLVSLMAATCLLMAQPSITTPTVLTRRAPNPGRRRKDDLGDVTLIDLRRVQTVRDDHDPAGSGRGYHRRWIVGGHWRQQPFGPRGSQRRPTWIAPHVKGPPDAPLVTERVNVWRR